MRHQLLLGCLIQIGNPTLAFYAPKFVSRRNHYPNSLATELSIHGSLGVTKLHQADNVVSSSKESSNTINPSARSVAVFTLMKCLGKQNRTFGIRQLENDPDFLLLDTRDKAFARLLFSTVERRYGQIDKVVFSFSKSKKPKKLSSVDRLCRSAILIGAAQILFLDVAEHAAILDTVEVLRMHPKVKVS